MPHYIFATTRESRTRSFVFTQVGVRIFSARPWSKSSTSPWFAFNFTVPMLSYVPFHSPFFLSLQYTSRKIYLSVIWRTRQFPSKLCYHSTTVNETMICWCTCPRAILWAIIVSISYIPSRSTFKHCFRVVFGRLCHYCGFLIARLVRRRLISNSVSNMDAAYNGGNACRWTLIERCGR